MRTSLAAIAVCLLLVGAANARAECRPTAVPIGDASIVRALSDRLSASGIATTAVEGCPGVRVSVAVRGDQLQLQMTDAYQRRGERQVHDVATAAAVIESWTLQEIDPGALPPEATPIVTSASATVVATSLLGAAARSWIGDDGSTWIGGAIGGCMRIGWSCMGATLDIGSDTTAVEDVSSGSHRSLAIHALATADVPRRIRGFIVSPGVTLGYGWNRIQQQHLDMHMMPASISHANHALRAGAHIDLARSLGSHVSVFASVFGDIAALRTEIPDGPRGRLGFSLGARLEAP